MREWLRRPASLVLIAAASVTALGVFSVAWYVPNPSEPVVSMAYGVGYNNVVAWISVVVGCALAFAAGRMRRRAAGKAGEDSRAGDTGKSASEPVVSPADSDGRVPRLDVIVLASAMAVATAVFAYFTYGVPMADNGFFFSRISQALGGAVPWKELYFPYGPLMLYPPLGLAWLTAKTSAGPILGYYLALGISHVSGILMLAWILGRLPVTRARKRALFWLVGAWAFLGVFGGLNYTLVRFLTPVACMVALAAWMERERPMAPAVLASASLGLAALNGALSPEMAFAYAVGSTGMLALRGGGGGVKRYTAAAVQLGVLGVAAIALGSAVSFVVAAQTGGAFRLPVMPSPYMFLYGGTALWASYALGAEPLGTPRARLCAGLLLTGLALAPVALGRADFGHVFLDGLPIFLAAAAMVRRERVWPFWTWLGGLAVAFVAWEGVFAWMFLGTGLATSVRAGNVPKSVLISLGKVIAPQWGNLGKAYDASMADRPAGRSLDRLMELDDVALPFGAVDTLEFEYAVRGKLVPTWGEDTGPVNEEQLRIATRQLDRARWVVMPAETARAVAQSVTTGDVQLSDIPPYQGDYTSVIVQFPVDMRVRRKEFMPRLKFGTEVFKRFEYSETVGRYMILRRR